jgi:hypothetical protein
VVQRGSHAGVAFRQRRIERRGQLMRSYGDDGRIGAPFARRTGEPHVAGRDHAQSRRQMHAVASLA